MTKETGTLKELKVKPGDVLQCVDNRNLPWWTTGKFYEVEEGGTLIDDDGDTLLNSEELAEEKLLDIITE